MENKKSKIVNFAPHTHWDREWYFSINDSALLSTYNFEKVLDVLENDDEYKCFHLDGQTSIIEDMLEFKPELEPRIRELVKSKRLFIGPWYTQTDSFYVDGESYIRNLYFGTKKADELGGTMEIGYLPDTFGHNIQTPQLFKGFGIENIIFWRGYDEEKIPSPYFNWKGIDGSETLGINLTYGYGAAKWLTDTEKEWNEKTIPMARRIDSMTEYNNILLPSGGDQVLIDPDLPKKVEKLNAYSDEYEYKVNSYEGFVKELKEEIGELSNLQEVVAEFRDPVEARVHRTIGSSRYDLKKLSYELENKLVNILEPLTIIVSEKVDKGLVNNSVIEKSWKLLLDGHAHDSLGACNTDITNENIINRFKRAENLVDGMINIFEKTIATNLKNQFNEELVLFNFDSKTLKDTWREIVIYSKSENVEIVDNGNVIESNILNKEKLSGGRKVIVTPEGEKEVEIDPYFKLTMRVKPNIKPFGYKLFKVNELEGEANIITSTDNVIENENLKLLVSDNRLSLIIKKQDKAIENFLRLENVANDGDSYDFSPMANDTAIETFKLINSNVIKTNNFSILTFVAEVEIPACMLGRSERSNEFVKQQFEFKVTLNGEGIEFEIDTINKAKDHRFRLIVDTGINSSKTKTEVPFGFIEREYVEVQENWNEKYVEKPVNYYPIINTFYKNTDDYSVTVTTKGMKEIEIFNDSKVGITMYKSDEYLGKDDLAFRPNRASGINNTVVKTPDAQLFDKELKFEFKIDINSKNICDRCAFTNKYNYITRFDYYQSQLLNTTQNRLERFQLPINVYELEREVSLMNEVDEANLVASYISHKSDSRIFRFVNMNDNVMDKEYFVNKLDSKVVNFKEDEIEQGGVVNKYQLITLKKNVK